MKNKKWGKLKDKTKNKGRLWARSSGDKQEETGRNAGGRQECGQFRWGPAFLSINSSRCWEENCCQGALSLRATWGATRPLAPPANELLSGELERLLLLLPPHPTSLPRPPAVLPPFALNALISGFERKRQKPRVGERHVELGHVSVGVARTSLNTHTPTHTGRKKVINK